MLIYSAYGLLTEGDQENEDLSDNAIVRLTKEYLPSTDLYDEDKFFTVRNNQTLATPLLLSLVCVELSDVRSRAPLAAAVALLWRPHLQCRCPR